MTVVSRPTHAVALLLVSVLSAAFLFGPSAQAQTITINEARNQGVGASVTVEGTVTRAFGDFVRFQDESGPTGASGLVVRQTETSAFRDSVRTGAITQGTQLQVSGTLSEFNGLLQINNDDLDSFTIQGQGGVPAAQSVELSTIRSSGEDFESELVRVTSLDFLKARGTFEQDTSYPVTDGSGAQTLAGGTVTFRVQGSGETTIIGRDIPGGVFDYTGVVGEFSGQFQLIPVRPSDAQSVRSFGFTQQFAQAEEGSGTVEVDVKAFATESGDDVSVTATLGGGSTADAGDVDGFSGAETLNFSGSDPAPQTLSFDPVDDGTDEGVERLEVVLESSDGAIARPQRFTLWLLDSPAVQTTIAEGDSGDVLIDSLQQQFADPRPLGDDFARDSMYAVVYNESGNTVEGQYSGFQITVDPSEGDPSAIAFQKGINNEHTWPQSQGAGEEPATSDLHILMPARVEVNDDRSNFAYGEIPDADTDQWFFEDQSQTGAPPESDRPLWSELDDSPPNRDDRRFEPRHSVKGDVARAAFYFVTTYPNRANFSFFDVQRETLLDWHEQDPVDATEMRRNLIQASYQGNVANPFVLDSTLADRAYGSGADAGDDPAPPSGVFELVAEESDLTPPSGQTDAQCIVQISSGEWVFFNSEDGGIFRWDGSSLSVHRSSQNLNSDISSESNDINRCDGVAEANDVLYFLFRSSETNDNFVYRTVAADPADNAFEQFNGADGIAADGSTVYLSAISAFGAPANGIFEISEDLSGSPAELAANENVSSGALDVLGGTLFGYSDDFGSGEFGRTLFSLDVTNASPSFQVLVSPFGSQSPLTGGDPSNDDVDGIQDVKAVTFNGTEFVVVHNQNSTAPNGEEFGTVQVADQTVDLLFTATDLVDNLPVSEYSSAFAHGLDADDQGDVFVTSGAFGPNYIAKVSEAPPLPVEMAGFDAVQSDNAVELTWQTASETNNAGFQVQRRSGTEGSEWTQIGFREGAGTTERAQSYRFTDPNPPFEADALTYRLKQVDLDGTSSFSEPVTLRQTADRVILRAPFPNPTQGQATVQFAVPEQQDISLRLYDVLGRHVKTLASGAQKGRREAQFDVSDLSSGVYFLRLQAGDDVQTKRLNVVR